MGVGYILLNSLETRNYQFFVVLQEGRRALDLNFEMLHNQHFSVLKENQIQEDYDIHYTYEWE